VRWQLTIVLGLLLVASPAGSPLAATPGSPAAFGGDPADDLGARQARARALREEGQAHAAQGRLAEAIDAFRRAINAYPAYPLAFNELGAAYAARGNLIEAEASFVAALRLDPDSVDARVNLAEVLRRLGRPDAALHHLRSALAAQPDDPGAWFVAAGALLATGDEAGALHAMERFLHVTAGTGAPRIPAVTRRAEELIAAGVERRDPWPEGAPVVDDEDATDPRDATPEEPAVIAAPEVLEEVAPGELARHRGDRDFYERRYVDALGAYHAALEANPDDVTLLYKIGATLAVMGDYDAATRSWRRALLLEPDRALVARHLGLALMRRRAGPPVAPRRAILDALEAGRLALIAGDPAHALMHLHDADGGEAEQLRGEARLLLGDLAGARAAFEAILALRPDDRDAQGALAETLVRLGHQGPAEAAMRAWLGDLEVAPETFLVMRHDDVMTRLTSEPEE